MRGADLMVDVLAALGEQHRNRVGVARRDSDVEPCRVRSRGVRAQAAPDGRRRGRFGGKFVQAGEGFVHARLCEQLDARRKTVTSEGNQKEERSLEGAAAHTGRTEV